MVDTILVKQRIEPGMTDRAAALLEMVDGDDATVLDVLGREGVHTETAFLKRGGDGDDFVLYYIEAEDGARVKDVFDAITADPDAEEDELGEFLREFDEVMAGEPFLADFEPLYHLVRSDRSGQPD